MYIPTSLLALFALTAQPLLAAKLTIIIGSNELLPSAAALLPTTRARLSSPSSRHTASLSPSNSFHLSNLTAGSYLFTIHALDFDFTPLRIDIEQTAGGEELVEAAATFRQNDWGHRGEILGRARGSTKGEEAHLQFTVKALRRREYYEPRPAFNPIDLLKNPMILIGALGLGAVVLMPKLLDNSKSALGGIECTRFWMREAGILTSVLLSSSGS